MNTFFATLCVVLFSLTIPATRIAAQAMPPQLVATLRLLGASGVCLAVVLLVDRWIPPRRIWLSLLATSFGSVWGFSLLGALAMKTVPASHGAIGLAALPALTATYASLRDRQSPGARFWAYSLSGTLASFGFFLAGAQGAGQTGGLRTGDLLLFAAIFASAFGYVEGARLSREFGGRRVMSWAVLLALPFGIGISLPLFISSGFREFPRAPSPWIAVAYLAVVSQSLGMFLWYRVLARGPMAKIAMIQLLQPFLALVGAVVLVGETTSPATWLTAVVVAASVFGANAEKAANSLGVKGPDVVDLL